MSDVNCPYCGHGQEICHDDGYGFDEDTEHEQHCRDCGKRFRFTTAIAYHYEVFCEGEHDLEQSPIAKYPDLYSCSRCDYYEVRATAPELEDKNEHNG